MKFLTVFFLILHSLTGSPQSSYYLVDEETGQPLAGASISKGMNDLIISDENGKFSLSSDYAGPITISFIGFASITISVQELTDGQVIALQPATSTLSEVVVIGYDSRRMLLETAGSIALISPEELTRYNESSMVPVLNSVPGIRMEERSFGSYRLSIRGSLLRSPFGVRNVKVYWNDIPFTEPNGNTPLNLLDLNNIGRIEIIKGPAGSIFGAGTGGVVNITSPTAKFRKKSIEGGISIGSYGFLKTYSRINSGNEKSNLSLNITHQEAEGYRQHSNFNRNVIQWLGSFRISENSVWHTSLLYSDLYYDIPGGLNRLQYDSARKQSRPGSISQNASIDLKTLLLGLSHDYKLNDNVSNITSIYLLNSIFRNPFITDFKRDAQQGFGGRSRFNFNLDLTGHPLVLTTGTEFQTSFTNARNFGNVSGQPDTIRFDDEIRATQVIFFAQAQFDITPKLILTSGLSYNTLKYQVNRLIDASSSSSFRVSRNFDPEISPRVALVYKISNVISAHGSISSGFGPPTLAEFRTNEGSLNTDLNAEKGINYEIGLRGSPLKEKLNFDLALFSFNLKETIVTQTAPSGVVIFTNTGETSQKGLELLVNYLIVDKPSGFVTRLKAQTAYTFHDFNFKEYIKKTNDFSGNSLTGIAPQISVTTMDIETRHGFYSHLTYNYTDRIPLNDANSVYSSSYHLAEIKLGFKKQITKGPMVDIYVGINNLFDEKYSLGNDLNAFGPPNINLQRFFQPSPEINYYGGVKVKYSF